MAKLKTGSLLPEFRYDTPFEKDLAIAHFVSKAEKTAILFLRYYGCPTCQLDMHNISQNYKEIKQYFSESKSKTFEQIVLRYKVIYIELGKW